MYVHSSKIIVYQYMILVSRTGSSNSVLILIIMYAWILSVCYSLIHLYIHMLASYGQLHDLIFIGILLLITYVQRDLYCTSEVLIEALSNPSTFCRLTGEMSCLKNLVHT